LVLHLTLTDVKDVIQAGTEKVCANNLSQNIIAQTLSVNEVLISVLLKSIHSISCTVQSIVMANSQSVTAHHVAVFVVALVHQIK
jgi:hypothetical protein